LGWAKSACVGKPDTVDIEGDMNVSYSCGSLPVVKGGQCLREPRKLLANVAADACPTLLDCLTSLPISGECAGCHSCLGWAKMACVGKPDTVDIEGDMNVSYSCGSIPVVRDGKCVPEPRKLLAHVGADACPTLPDCLTSLPISGECAGCYSCLGWAKTACDGKPDTVDIEGDMNVSYLCGSIPVVRGGKCLPEPPKLAANIGAALHTTTASPYGATTIMAAARSQRLRR